MSLIYIELYLILKMFQLNCQLILVTKIICLTNLNKKEVRVTPSTYIVVHVVPVVVLEFLGGEGDPGHLVRVVVGGVETVAVVDVERWVGMSGMCNIHIIL